MKKLPLWIERQGGLDFSCTRCGYCCTGAPGYVWVGEEEIDRLARDLGLARDEFGRRFLRRVDGRLSLLERPDGDCIFFERERGCTVYGARPEQCRTYPFWPELLRTRGRWVDEGRRCPGIGSTERRFGAEEVLRLAAGRGEA